MRVYVAGPMRNLPYFNFPAFFGAEKMLTTAGHSVFNPARRDVNKYGKKIANKKGDVQKASQMGFSLREALAADTHYICMKADAIALLPGWAKSSGAKAEHALAKALGLTIMYLKKTKNDYIVRT